MAFCSLLQDRPPPSAPAPQASALRCRQSGLVWPQRKQPCVGGGTFLRLLTSSPGTGGWDEMVKLVDNSMDGKKACGTLLNKGIGFLGSLHTWPSLASGIRMSTSLPHPTAFRTGRNGDCILELYWGGRNPSGRGRRGVGGTRLPRPQAGAVGRSECQQQDCRGTWGRAWNQAAHGENRLDLGRD